MKTISYRVGENLLLELASVAAARVLPHRSSITVACPEDEAIDRGSSQESLEGKQ